MKNKTNIIFIYADDLGQGMLSCYGQQHFSTPNIDRLAGEGMRFTQAYGCAFCAPSRASMMTGLHDCHRGTWTYTRGGIYNQLSAGQITLREINELIHTTGLQTGANEVFLPQVAADSGYVTGQIGKCEWGFDTTGDRIRRHGWQYHYGYYDHARCHGFYPPFLFENGQMVEIRGNTRPDCGVHLDWESPQNSEIRQDRKGKAVYSQDIFDQKIKDFLQRHRNTPFFLYHPSQLPHGPIAIPEIHPEVKDNPNLTPFEKEYASMVLRLDQTVGLILEELERLGIDDRTMIVFSSDNGHEVYALQQGRTTGRQQDLNGQPFDNIKTKFYSDMGGDIFNGNGGMAGLKWSSWEGGTRIPYLVRFPGVIEPDSVSDHMLANFDFMPTLADLIGVEMPAGKDGISFLPTLLGKSQQQHDFIVYASGQGPALVTVDGWKLRYINQPENFQLYDLKADYREEDDLAADHPDLVDKLSQDLLTTCDDDYRHGTPQAHYAAYPEPYT